MTIPTLFTPRALHSSEIACEIARRIEFFTDRSMMNWWDIDAVDASMLPHLLKLFSLEEYAAWNQLGETGIREIIKNALPIVRLKGTPWAINFTLGLIGVGVELVEWWQIVPKGEPYTATAIAWSNLNYASGFDPTDPADFVQIEVLVNAVKAVSRRILLTTGFYDGEVVPPDDDGWVDPDRLSEILGLGLWINADQYDEVLIDVAPIDLPRLDLAIVSVADSFTVIEFDIPSPVASAATPMIYLATWFESFSL
jgi:phage tail P2-like protein